MADRAAREKFAIFGSGMHNCDDGFIYTAPVRNFRANGFELHDMLGNIWEWCEDVYSSDAYDLHQRNNPIYRGDGSKRVIRGGSWGSIPADLRCANRSSYPTDPGSTTSASAS